MRADLYTAPFLLVLGALFIYGGWTMDRLEIRQIHPASIPGLVPMLLGGALAVASVVLFVQALGQRGTFNRQEDAAPGSFRDLLKAALLCCVYAIGLVGHIPFVMATALFIAAFVLAFEVNPEEGRAHLVKTAAIAVSLGIVVAAALGILFRYAFLVRLP